jgi:C1A family cysteine protease
MAGVARPVHLRGWRPDTKDHRDYALPPAAPALPPAASLRSQCSPVVDQGGLGSCTANASCEAMSFLYRRALADPLFSRLFVYYYTRKLENTRPADDSGAQIRDVMKTLALYGAPLEATWPYAETMFSAEPSHDAFVEAAHHRLLFYYRCPDLLTVKASIAQGFPVVIGFTVPANMDSPECARTGVVKYPAPSENFVGGHAVLAVGYDNATELVCVQNSWGSGWGDAGFGYLPYRMFADGFVEDCWTLRREQMN